MLANWLASARTGHHPRLLAHSNGAALGGALVHFVLWPWELRRGIPALTEAEGLTADQLKSARTYIKGQFPPQIETSDQLAAVLTQFPNSKFAPEAQQRLREIQEVLAQHEFVVGDIYHHKGSFPAAANRLNAVVDAYPLFSKADEALWKLGDSYGRMGPRFADKSAAAYARIVKDYPLSSYADEAKGKLEEMEKPIPQADPVAYARQKYEIENRTKQGPLFLRGR